MVLLVEVRAQPEREHRRSPGRCRAVQSLWSENPHQQDQEETGPSSLLGHRGTCYHGTWAGCQELGLGRREVPREGSRALSWDLEADQGSDTKWSKQGGRLSPRPHSLRPPASPEDKDYSDALLHTAVLPGNLRIRCCGNYDTPGGHRETRDQEARHLPLPCPADVLGPLSTTYSCLTCVLAKVEIIYPFVQIRKLRFTALSGSSKIPIRAVQNQVLLSTYHNTVELLTHWN